MSYRRELFKDSAKLLGLAFRQMAERRSPRWHAGASIQLARRSLNPRATGRHVEKYQALWESFHDVPPRVIVEVGSFDGLDALELSRMFPRARVFTFEAVSNNYETVKRTVRVRRQINPIRRAVFDFTGEGVFHASGTLKGEPDSASGSMLAPVLHKMANAYPSLTFPEQLTVPTITLADWAAGSRVRSIDLLWMDAQGAELRILEGAGDLLASTRAILLEVWEEPYYDGAGTLSDIDAYLSGRGFTRTCSWMQGDTGDVLFQRRDATAEAGC